MRGPAVLALGAVVGLGGTASARPAADDLATIVFLSRGVGVTQVQGLTVGVVVEVEGSTGVARPVTIRATLPAGLGFGTPPATGDGCVGDPASLTCTKTMVLDAAGTARASWRWDLRASGPGRYVLTVTASSDEADPNPGNNTGTLEFEVLVPPAASTVAAGPARVVPARPRAGRSFAASVSVTVDGRPVRPGRIVCTATVAGARLRGTPRGTAGLATCTFRTPATAQGKLLRGSLRLTAGGRSFARSFSVRLR
ncbi:MAG TPA: hypothetical protein VNJ53_10685 [Gaiellaceae bacterium]|nr:hypothetical protein [Gaiellaceae bacterium]